MNPTFASPHPIVLAITGASGAVFATRLLQVLTANARDVHLTISPSGAAVIKQELGLSVDVRAPDLDELLRCVPQFVSDGTFDAAVTESIKHSSCISYHAYDDYMTPIASGSFRTAAMVICPCSGSTLSGIARSAASNLITRAAEVHLKEHRKLILVPRETPMSVIQIENMHRIAPPAAVILPAMPGWYHDVKTMADLIDFIVSRILDQLDFDNDLMQRWQ